MPVLHNSPEWIKLNETVTETKVKVTSLEDALKKLSREQDQRHKENVERMDAIEARAVALDDKVEEIFMAMAEVKGAFEATKSIGKLVAWLLGVIIAWQTISTFFGPMIRTHMGLPNAAKHQPEVQGHIDKYQPFTAQDQ
jgi:hypothetical protein